MNTRYKPEGAPVSFERYMSSPEYVELRGIPGTAVAAKAQMYADVRKRSLLFFLQSLSLKDGGLRQVARKLLETSRQLPDEGALENFLVEICINPELTIQFADEEFSPGESERRQLCKEISGQCFNNAVKALREFQKRYEEEIKSDFVATTIAKEIFETLDHALEIQKMVVIEGESGSGKTTAAEAWCDLHQGEVRFVSLSGITQKTGFFRRLAFAVGLAASKRKAIDMQVRVEEFFRRTRLMLVIDEAHYLFPQHQQRHATPALVDWVNTALVNHHVPVALICTDQFAKLKASTEKRTGWTSEQLEHRVKRYKKLPTTPTKGDLEAVAAKLLRMRWNTRERQWQNGGPGPHRDFIKMIVGYALTCKLRLPAVSDTIQEARFQARKSGRLCIAATDIRSALLDYRIPSDQALQRAFETSTSRSSPSVAGRSQSVLDANLQSRCDGIANALQRRDRPMMR